MKLFKKKEKKIPDSKQMKELLESKEKGVISEILSDTFVNAYNMGQKEARMNEESGGKLKTLILMNLGATIVLILMVWRILTAGA